MAKKNKNMRHRKSGIVHKISRTSGNYFTSECGSAWGSRGIYESTSDEITCRRCLHNVRKEFLGEEGIKLATRRAKLDVKTIKTFQTSDGVTFNNEGKAYEHEEYLEGEKAQVRFTEYVRKEIFGNPDASREDLIMETVKKSVTWAFSGDLEDSINETFDIDDFSEELWNLFKRNAEDISKALKKFKELTKGE